MDTGLLASSQADERPMEGVSNTVRLGVFKGKSGDDQIGDSARRKLNSLVSINMYPG